MKTADWLPEEWFDLFTKEETERAIKETGTTVDDLTDVEDLTCTPYGDKKEQVEGWHWATVKDVKVIKGVAYEAWVRKQVQSWRLPARYQGLKHEKIIRRILKNRFIWFDTFKWEIYELSNAENYEIYMHTEYGTLYVPVKALLEGKPELIEERMKSYHKSYYNAAGYKLNHKEGESFEEYKKRRKEEYKKALRPLESKEYKYLCKLMEVDKEMKQ